MNAEFCLLDSQLGSTFFGLFMQVDGKERWSQAGAAPHDSERAKDVANRVRYRDGPDEQLSASHWEETVLELLR